jgi:hypothetical protein
MTRFRFAVFALMLVWLLLGGGGCLMEEKVIEVVVKGETCIEFFEDHETQEYTTPVTVDYAQKIADILEEEGLSRSDIVEAKVMGATYQVTAFDHIHDWRISGDITAEHLGNGGPSTIIAYTNQSLIAAQPAPIAAHLDAAGVSVVNEALQAYIDGGSPMLRFEVNNGIVDPEPDESDRLVFTWEACIALHVVYREEVDVPDPL